MSYYYTCLHTQEYTHGFTCVHIVHIIRTLHAPMGCACISDNTLIDTG